MSALATHDPRRPAPTTRPSGEEAPIVAAVDASASGAAAAREAIPIAQRLGAPVVFVYVRSGPSSILGEPYYQRRLDTETFASKRALGEALAAAEEAGVAATGEVLDGAPARRLIEFARLRGARMVVLGPRRRRRFRKSVSRKVIGAADRPVLVAEPRHWRQPERDARALRPVGCRTHIHLPTTTEDLMTTQAQRAATERRHAGRFSEGIEQLPDTPRKLRVGRYSEGIEQLPDTPRKLRVGRYSRGVEQLPEAPSTRRRGSFADGYTAVR